MNEELRMFIVFGFIALIRTGIDIVLWQVLVWIFQPESWFVKLFKPFKLNRYALAQALSFVISSIISYFANKIWAFDNDDPTTPWVITKFLVVTITALVASVWFIELLTTNKKILDKIEKYKLIKNQWPLIAKILTVVITAIINYLGFRLWVFI